MPGFNQTGPTGQGPLTGRRMGRCTNFGAKLKNETSTADENSKETMFEDSQGRGFRFGRKRGRRGFGGRQQNRFRGGF